ncbi:hypothetical protein GPUN_1049 [Glaciecola punicea ACAM 611]|uniref:Uncharacterized protein n=1 Tax=Glaciecola punicea ACAM 611 TaxID=1121923 RepID=H5TA53_9ALTE|nr:hypothetical protein GPUN_1049 [Glaciecola punicea ACAM 611]
MIFDMKLYTITLWVIRFCVNETKIDDIWAIFHDTAKYNGC